MPWDAASKRMMCRPSTRLVERIEKAESGRPSALLMGIIESAPFQKRRRLSARTGSHCRTEHARTSVKTDATISDQ